MALGSVFLLFYSLFLSVFDARALSPHTLSCHTPQPLVPLISRLLLDLCLLVIGFTGYDSLSFCARYKSGTTEARPSNAQIVESNTRSISA